MSSITINNTLGAAFLGNIAAACFYGITLLQTYIYYGRNGSDRLYLKCLVFVLWALDSVHLALITHSVYLYAVTDFANFLALEVPVWSILAQVIVTGVSDLIVRMIFCERVWKLSKRNWTLLIMIVTTSLVVFGGSIAFAVKGFGVPNFFALSEISGILYTSLGAGVVADILIAASMCVLLAQRQTGFARTDSMVRVLILYSVNTGALTSLCALLCLITYATMPDNFVFIGVYFVLPKLFLNSLLATLNARRPLREAGSGPMLSIPLTPTSISRGSPSGATQYSRSNHYEQSGLQIQVHRTTESKTDPEPHMAEDEIRRKAWGDICAGPQESIAIAV
ncbi:hypothetical protein FKP32DRAFT_693080 [Trametes sanguinea]|nr:hypothetical protein FKP32DRAFT_693080 [Trametes sanguinea]